jgi:S1-C subfamily serine protease
MNYSRVSHVSNLTARLACDLWIRTAGLVLLLGSVHALCAQSVDLKTMERAKKNIAPVICIGRDAETGTKVFKQRVFGTAFMVDDKGTFITANHVITSFNESPWNLACLPEITFPVGGWKRETQEIRSYRFIVAKCQVNEHWDVAVCRTINDLSKENMITYEPVKISLERPADGTNVFFTGFPLQADDPITSIGSVAGYAASDGYNTILIDKNAWPGASGSPIFLASSGIVIGMLTRTGVGDAAGISFGVAGERLTNILSSARSNWAIEEKKPPEKQ